MANPKRRMNARYGNVKKGTRPDLGSTFFRSGWEADVARWLNLLVHWGVLEGWAYEPQAFSFQGLGYKRGPFTFLPDFVIKYSNNIRPDVKEALGEILEEIHPGKAVFLEVKGQETGNDRSKWRRFRKHTDYNLEVVKRDKLLKIKIAFEPYIPHWESKFYAK